MTPAEQLATLPDSVQASAWSLIRVSADMTADEKAIALRGMTGVAEALLGLQALGDADHSAPLSLFAAIGELLREMHNQTNPNDGEAA